jgi:hypothetical protein
MQVDDDNGWPEDFENADIGNEDDGDTSWKVRRAAVKIIEAIVLSRPEYLKLIYEKYATKLVDRFKERDDKVKINILSTF